MGDGRPKKRLAEELVVHESGRELLSFPLLLGTRFDMELTLTVSGEMLLSTAQQRTSHHIPHNAHTRLVLQNFCHLTMY